MKNKGWECCWLQSIDDGCTWAAATEESALRLYARWIADGDPRVPVIVYCTTAAGARYAGAELRRRALTYLTQDALVAFLADYPVTHLYREIDPDGTPTFTAVTERMDFDREREMFAFHLRPDGQRDDASCNLIVVNPAIFEIPDGETFVFTPHSDMVEIALARKETAV